MTATRRRSSTAEHPPCEREVAGSNPRRRLHDPIYRIAAPHFVAGLEYDREGDMVHGCAPIIGYMNARTLDWVAAYCYRKNWKLERVRDDRPTS